MTYKKKNEMTHPHSWAIHQFVLILLFDIFFLSQTEAKNKGELISSRFYKNRFSN